MENQRQTPNEFTPGQEALIEKICYRVGEKLADRFKESLKTALDLHSATCSAPQAFEVKLAEARGAWWASGKFWAAVMAVVTIASVSTNIWVALHK